MENIVTMTLFIIISINHNSWFLEPSRTNQCNEKEHCHWILTLKTLTNQPTGPVAKRHVWQVPKPESGSPGTGRNGRIPTCHVPKSLTVSMLSNAFKRVQNRNQCTAFGTCMSQTLQKMQKLRGSQLLAQSR